MATNEELEQRIRDMADEFERKRAGPWEQAARISIPLVGILVVLVILQLTLGAAQSTRIDRLEANDAAHKKILNLHQGALEKLENK